jgi:hypothetical protein
VLTWQIDIVEDKTDSNNETETEPTPKASKKSSKNNTRHSAESKGEHIVDNVDDVDHPPSANEQILPVLKCKCSGNNSSAVQ